MKKYKVLCSFLVTGNLIVEAESAKEAQRIAYYKDSPLPKQPWKYVDGSRMVITTLGAPKETEEASDA